MWDKYSDLFISPKQFFREDVTRSWFEPFWTFFTPLAIMFMATLVIETQVPAYETLEEQLMFIVYEFILPLFALFVLVILMAVAYTALVHTSVLYFGTRKEFYYTYRTVMRALTIINVYYFMYFVVYLIAVFGGIRSITAYHIFLVVNSLLAVKHVFYIASRGIAHTHNLKLLRAMLTQFLPGLFYFSLIVISYFYLL